MLIKSYKKDFVIKNGVDVDETLKSLEQLAIDNILKKIKTDVEMGQFLKLQATSVSDDSALYTFSLDLLDSSDGDLLVLGLNVNQIEFLKNFYIKTTGKSVPLVADHHRV